MLHPIPIRTELIFYEADVFVEASFFPLFYTSSS